MIEIPGLVMNNGWKPCFPGGKDTPDEGEYILAIFYSHEPWGDILVMDLLFYTSENKTGGRYWSNTYCCDVHPLCWHPLPDLPGFIGMKEQENIDYIPFPQVAFRESAEGFYSEETD